MRQALAWMTVAVLCCAAGAAAGDAQPAPQLEQAREAFEKAGQLYGKGKYAEALVQARRALALKEVVLGGAHPEAAQCLDLLGILYQLQGDLAGAEPLLRRGLEIREAALGPNHPDVALSLNHLARLHSEQGRYELAEPLYERALTIQQGSLGKSHPEIASTLNNLASLYMSLGQYERAEPLATQALAMQQEALGRNHPDIATSLNNLALIFTRQGALEKAEPLYKRALAIVESTQGRNHPSVANLLNNLARLHVAGERLDDAVPLLQRAFAISELRLRREALDFSESRLASFMAHLRVQEELVYELLREAPDEERVRHLALTVALLRKGRSVTETADTSRTIYRRVNARDREDFARLRGLRTQLASLSLQGAGSLTLADYRQRLKELARQGDALEAELARRSAPLRALTALPAPEDVVDQVADALPSKGALVEFVAYMDRALLHRPNTREKRPTQRIHYVALVLFPDRSIRVLNLGAAEPIDSAAARMRDALANRDANFLAPAQELYRLVFHPLRRVLDDTRSVFLSPDGQLGLVPFDALHDGQGFLVDSYDFTYLTSGKELLPRAREVAPSQSVVVLADPDFSSPVAPSPEQAVEKAERSMFVERFYSTLRSSMSKQRSWVALPGTRGEAEAIQRMIPRAQLFLGAEATKERLLQLSAPGVLHVATHGFFLKDDTPRENTRGVGHFGALGEDALAAAPADPLLRSGLIMAGARAATPDASGAAAPPLDSVMVTALELAGLNLWGTQLVVLSACDTGRGDVKLGQGVYGLRRAFVAAGAETVVMSLWMVNDATTRVLMEGYYRELFKGRGRARSLRQAMLELRKTQPHPHYWAPFIVLGEEGPLRAMEAGAQAAPGK